MPFDWQQIDQRLSGILQSTTSTEIRKLITDDVGHIRFQNMHDENSMTVPSQRLQMQRLRTEEWAARLYEGYCEIWQTQRMPISAEFLRGIVQNAISTLCSARGGAVTGEFVREAHCTGSDANWLKPVLEAFKRDLQMLEHNWNQRAEFDARTVQYMLLEAPESTARKIAAREVITARARVRTLEAMIASIEARIAMAEQALNGMLTASTPQYRKRNVKQSLAKLREQRKELRSTLDEWQLRMQIALANAERAQADAAAGATSPNTREATEKGTGGRARRREKFEIEPDTQNDGRNRSLQQRRLDLPEVDVRAEMVLKHARKKIANADENTLMTVEEAAAILLVSPQTVYRWAEEGTRGVKRTMGTPVRIYALTVKAYLESAKE